MRFVKSFIRALIRDENGATMVEYGLMTALIAAVCIGTVTTLGNNVKTKFTSVSTAVG